MGIKNNDFLNGNPPMAGDDFLNAVKNEINNLILYFLDLDPSDREQQMQATLVANLGGLNTKPLSESTGTNYKVVFNSFKKTTFPIGFSFFDGMVIWLNNTISNTGSATITILDRGPYNILDRNGEPLEIGELKKGLQKLVYKDSFKAFYLDAEGLQENTLPPDFISGFSLVPFNFSQDQEVKDFITSKNLTKIEAVNFLIKKIVNKNWEENTDYNNNILVDDYSDDFPAMINNDDGINRIFASTQNNVNSAPYYAFDKVNNGESYVYHTTNNLMNQAIGRNNPNSKSIGGFKFYYKKNFQYQNSTKVEVLITEDNVASGLDPNILNNYNWVSKGQFNLNYDINGIATVIFNNEIVTKNIIFKFIDKIGLDDNTFSVQEIFILRKNQTSANKIARGALAVEPPYSYFNELPAMTSNYGSAITLPLQIAFATSTFSDGKYNPFKAFDNICNGTSTNTGYISALNTEKNILGRNNPLKKEIKGIRLFRGIDANYFPLKIKILATDASVKSGIDSGLESNYVWIDLGDFNTNFEKNLINGYIDIIFNEPNSYNNYAIKILERVDLSSAFYDVVSEIELLRKNYCNYVDVDFQPPMSSNNAPSPYIAIASSQLNATHALWKVFSKGSRLNDYYWRASDNITGQGVGRNNIHMDKVNYINIERRKVGDTYPTKIEVFGSNYIFTAGILIDLFTNEAYGNVSLGQYETGFAGNGLERIKIDISQFPPYRQYLFRVIERVGNYDIIEDIEFYGEKCQIDGNYKNWNPIQGYLFNINKGGEISVFDQAVDIDPEGSNILKNENILNANYSQLSASNYIASFLFDKELNLIDGSFKIMHKNYWVEEGKARSSDNITEIITSSKTLKTDSPFVSFSDNIEGSMGNNENAVTATVYKPMTSINLPIPLKAVSNGFYDINNSIFKIRDFLPTTAYLSVTNSFPVSVLINNPNLFDIYGIQLVAWTNELNRMPVKFDIFGSNDDGIDGIQTDINGSSAVDSFDNIKIDVLLSLDNQTWTTSEVKNYMFNSKNKYKWYGIKVYSSGDNQYVRVCQLNLLTKENIKDILLYRFAIKNLDNDKINFGIDTNINASNLMKNPNVSILGYTKFRYIGGMRYDSAGSYLDSYDSAIKIDSGGEGITDEFYQQFFKDTFYRRITPDYKRGITVINPFICPSEGFVICMTYRSGTGFQNIYCNGILVSRFRADGDGVETNSSFLVKKGDIITFSGAAGGTIFYPFYT